MNKPIPKDRSPIEKAVDALLEQVNAGRMPMPTGVIVHPAALPKDGPLTAAWREQQRKESEKEQRERLLPAGRKTTTLEQQLEDSLWALCEGIEPMHFQMDVLRHIPHMAGSSQRVRRFSDEGDYVFILCVCNTALRFARCQYVSHTDQVQCAEECLPTEGIRREDVLCSFHRAEREKNR